MEAILYILLGWNIVVFAVYGIDKWKAVHNKWRIKESILLLYAFLMGGVGALTAMHLFRHKTRHIKFKILIPLALIVNIAVVTGVFYLANREILTL